MFRLLFPLTLALTPALSRTAEPARILPTTVTLNQPNGTLAAAAAEVRKQTGLPLDAPAGDTPCPLTLDRVPVWDAVQRIADRTDTQLTLHNHGRRVALTPRTGPAQPASTDGPFRVAVEQVRAVTDFGTGRTFTEMVLDIHWEPRVSVFRLDAQPTITAAADDRGSTITASGAKAKTPPVGAVYTTTVRLTGVPRAATKLTTVAGTFTVTAAERMLRISERLGKEPVRVEREGITVAVGKPERVENRVAVQVDLTYPPETPHFESFESFVTNNEAVLTRAGQSWPAADSEVSANGRRVTAVYRFAEDPKAGRVWAPDGWTLDYTTPAPLVEYPVRFTLKDVPLP